MKSATLIGLVSLLAALSLPAAKAPREKAELEAESGHIVSGTVLKVESIVARSKIETGLGIHTDRIFTIEVRVTSVAKGEKIKEGDVIQISAWQPEQRIPDLPGLQGHENIPTKGNRVTLYLNPAGEGGKFEPILPNGIQILD